MHKSPQMRLLVNIRPISERYCLKEPATPGLAKGVVNATINTGRANNGNKKGYRQSKWARIPPKLGYIAVNALRTVMLYPIMVDMVLPDHVSAMIVALSTPKGAAPTPWRKRKAKRV